MTELCSEEEISALIAELQEGEDDITAIDVFVSRYPNDPRLHFIKGSVLASQQRYIEAYESLKHAVQLAPEFHLARYQLGFFELTSGEADQALSTWGPLLRLPKDLYLRQFVEGATALIRDEFDIAIEHFERGMVLNTENEPMNNDIALLVEKTKALQAGEVPGSHETGDEAVQSATSIILGQFGHHGTRH